MTFTRAPVEAESSVTELLFAFRHPDVGAIRGYGQGAVELVARAGDDIDQGAGRGESSVTSCRSRFAAQMWVPFEAMADGLLNP